MKKITIKDIAKIAGVDHSTVSRSLNDSPRVAEKTKKRIKDIARELGFEYNYNARALSSRRTQTIGVIFPEFYNDINIGTFLSDLMGYIQRGFERLSYNIILEFSNNKYTGESNIQSIIRKNKVDGLLLVTKEITEEDKEYIKATSTPHIFLHYLPEDSEDRNYVYTDHYRGGYIAGEYLVKTGHKKIITVSSREYKGEHEERTEGFLKALEDNNIDFNRENLFFYDTIFHKGEDFVKENLEVIKNSDAIFVQTDIVALGIIQELKNQNINVPEDISIIGYDDIEIGAYFKPYLTTIHQPKEQASDVACNMLIELLNKKGKKYQNKKYHEVIEPRLVIRESVKNRNGE